jgi:hypothetical protein
MRCSSNKNKIILAFALLTAVVLGAVFGIPQEGLAMERKNPKKTEEKVKYETSNNTDNNGSRLGDPLAWDKNSSLSQSLNKCKRACAGLADCLGFTQDLDLKQCVLRSSKGTNAESATINSFWKI